MRCALLVCCLVLPPAAWGQKPPPAGVPWTGGSGPNAVAPGTAPTGKPPPLAAGESGKGEAALPPIPDPSVHAESSGTGFIVADGRLLTNRHVVAGCERMVARNSAGTRYAAHVDVAERDRDLALLTADVVIGPPLVFRDAPPVRRGEQVVTYGFPLSGLLSSGPSLTTGNVSAMAGLRDNPKNFQISAAVQPGNSGGPLFDSQAHVIGVVVSKLNAERVARLTGGDIPQNVNFAVKGTEALAFLHENGVDPKVAASTGGEKRADEIDAVANPSTLYLQCYK